MNRVLLLLTLLVVPSTTLAQDDVPPIVTDGFALLLADGPAAAIDTWTAAWTAEADLIRQAQLKHGFDDMWETLGHATEYEIVTTSPIGTKVVDVFAVTVHVGQPLYLFLQAYDAPGGWMVTQVYANTSMTDVFPEWVMRGGR